MKEGLSSIKYMAFQFSTELSEQNIQNQFFCGFARNLPVSICNGTLSHLNLPYITNLPKVNNLKLVHVSHLEQWNHAETKWQGTHQGHTQLRSHSTVTTVYFIVLGKSPSTYT